MAGSKMHDGIASGPVTKRQKTQGNSDSSAAQLIRQSKIFAPFRVSSSRMMDDMSTTDLDRPSD
jgi:hypothetical protein